MDGKQTNQKGYLDSGFSSRVATTRSRALSQKGAKEGLVVAASVRPALLSLLQCKLEFHACSTGKSLTTLCDGPCPCLPEPEPPKQKAEKNGEWGS